MPMPVLFTFYNIATTACAWLTHGSFLKLQYCVNMTQLLLIYIYMGVDLNIYIYMYMGVDLNSFNRDPSS